MRLETIRNITGKIMVVTGLHIGASNENIEIGGLDNPIIKDPLPGSNAPYIPGSSLKGKIRSLLEIRHGRFEMSGRNQGNPCKCRQKDCPVCPVFGTPATKEFDDLGPTRLVVRDAHLSKSWQEKFDSGELPMEIKYENSINRINGMANPRPLERVPAGVTFDFSMTLKKFDTDNDSYFNTLLEGMRLLELDALGGSGSRGCGQVKFIKVQIDGAPQPDDFLENAVSFEG